SGARRVRGGPARGRRRAGPARPRRPRARAAAARRRHRTADRGRARRPRPPPARAARGRARRPRRAHPALPPRRARGHPRRGHPDHRGRGLDHARAAARRARDHPQVRPGAARALRRREGHAAPPRRHARAAEALVSGRLLSVNVGRPRTVPRASGTARTAIWKDPVDGRVAVRGVNVDGDDQADRRVHGGPDKAVYAYAAEDTAWWEDALGEALGPGAFGENLTVAGLDVTGALIGERWAIGTTLLEVCQPRFPCFKLGLRFGDPRMVKGFAEAGRPGAYLR